MTARRFVHLSVHTEYSLVDSTVRIPALMQALRADGMPAVALTDQNNLFAMVKFYTKAIAAGIKPLIGADLRLVNEDDASRPHRLLLYCQNNEGYRRLSELLTRAYIEGQVRGEPLARREWLTEESVEGLLALSGGLGGDVGQALASGQCELALERLNHWRRLFPDRFYLELTRTGRPQEEDCVQASLRLASSTGTPVVASNDVRFIRKEDFNAHEARVCIHQGRGLADPDRPRAYSTEQYLKSSEEMCSLFADVPEAIENSLEIAKRLNLDLELGKSVLPAFPVPEGQDEAEFLTRSAEAGLEERLEPILAERSDDAQDVKSVYVDRLATELDVIKGMGFPGYFLIVADFIRWARDNGVPVGPGRGSGAGSLVAWVLGITDLDPIEHDLLFERFLNPERVSMPDFDVDFCMEGRDRVIDYVAERYGRERVAQIITFGTMAAKAVIRDSGRVLGQPYGFVDRIAKQVPFEIGMTLDKALEQSDELSEMYRSDEEVAAIIDLARSLEGLVRNAGKHAGGVVIAPDQLTDFTPLYCEEGGVNVVTQLDKDDVEAAGLVKFDFLGLKTLTIIDWSERIINQQDDRNSGERFDVGRIPARDPATFRLLQSTKTAAVFQLESSGMRDLIGRLKPDQFDDLVALVALFRPGPLQSGMVDDFIERKHSPDAGDIDYLHPDLKPVLEATYGVILYQEQVMQIAQVLAGYTLGGADLLRRAMGKKKPEEMAKQREIFVSGAVARGVNEANATRIFDLMEKFAGYGFNKSHSAAYAVLSYQTAYLKAHYPAAFMAAVMSADLDHTDRLVTLKDDCRQLGLKLVPPDVNRSAYHFSVADENTILYGLGAIKGVGRAAVEALIEEREHGGPYADLAEFCRRVDADKLNRRTLEAMIKSGAFDVFDNTRRGLMQQVGSALKGAEQAARAAAAGQNDMFGLETPPPVVVEETRAPEMSEWPKLVLLRNEKEALGLYLTGHPFDEVRHDAGFFVDRKLGDFAKEPAPKTAGGERDYSRGRREATVAGLIVEFKKRGNRVSVVIDDDTGRMEIALFSEAYEEFRDLLVKEEIVVVSGGLRYDDFIGGWTLNAKSVEPIDRVIEARARHMLLRLSPNGQGTALLTELQQLLTPYRNGSCDVAVQYCGSNASARLALGAEWSVRPSRELRDKLDELLGHGNVKLQYAPGREIM